MSGEELAIIILKDRILIENIKVKSTGMISVISSDEEQVLTGLVLKTGASVDDVKVDDKVMYEKHTALPINYLGSSYFILRESDVIAILS